MADPVEFVAKKLPYDLSSHAGLVLVGRLLKCINLPALIDPKYPVRGGIANSDILKCYLGLLTLGKNDFEAVEGFRSQRLRNDQRTKSIVAHERIDTGMQTFRGSEHLCRHVAWVFGRAKFWDNPLKHLASF